MERRKRESRGIACQGWFLTDTCPYDGLAQGKDHLCHSCEIELQEWQTGSLKEPKYNDDKLTSQPLDLPKS